MFKILGVDPGSVRTGYGVIIAEGNRFDYVAAGTIVPPRTAGRYQRLRLIFSGIEDIIQQYRPTHFAIEDIFYAKNARSSLVLGEARGVAILAATLHDLPVAEYSPREVKLSVTGQGGADKSQVSFMLERILGLTSPIATGDASDALAVAVCHAFKSREWSIT